MASNVSSIWRADLRVVSSEKLPICVDSVWEFSVGSVHSDDCYLLIFSVCALYPFSEDMLYPLSIDFGFCQVHIFLVVVWTCIHSVGVFPVTSSYIYIDLRRMALPSFRIEVLTAQIMLTETGALCVRCSQRKFEFFELGAMNYANPKRLDFIGRENVTWGSVWINLESWINQYSN